MTKVALLGTGIMGAPMARNIAGAGFEVQVWNRTRAKAEALADVAKVCDTAAEAAAGADVIITMLENNVVVADVFFGSGGVAAAAKSGAYLVDMSSIQPHVASEHAAKAEGMGLHHLDAPVSGGEKGAINAKLVIFAGGVADDYAVVKPVFEAMGRPTHVGKHGAGQVAKLANQVIVGVTIGAVAEALLLAQEGGCDPEAVRGALMGGFATSPILELHGQRMLDRNWVPGGPLRMHLKDLNNTLEKAAEVGLKLPLAEQAQVTFNALTHDLAMDGNDHSAYLRWLEEINPGKRLGSGPDQLPDA